MESSLEKQLVELYLAGADIIGEGLDIHHMYKTPAERREKVEKILAKVGLAPERLRRSTCWVFRRAVRGTATVTIIPICGTFFSRNTNVISLRPIRRRLWRCRKPKANGFRC